MHCSYGCGFEAEEIRHHSGVPECGVCWDWRKLDGPAASHWAKVTREFLSNIDLYDCSKFFDRCGIADKIPGTDVMRWQVMLASADQMLWNCEGMLCMSAEQRRMSWERSHDLAVDATDTLQEGC